MNGAIGVIRPPAPRAARLAHINGPHGLGRASIGQPSLKARRRRVLSTHAAREEGKLHPAVPAEQCGAKSPSPRVEIISSQVDLFRPGIFFVEDGSLALAIRPHAISPDGASCRSALGWLRSRLLCRRCQMASAYPVRAIQRNLHHRLLRSGVLITGSSRPARPGFLSLFVYRGHRTRRQVRRWSVGHGALCGG
jgi:hypothetical protein